MLGRIAPCAILIVGLAFGHAGAANGAGPGDSVDSIPRKLFQQFNSKHDNRWKVEWNEATGAPRRISGSYIDIKKAPTPKTVEPVTRGVLSTHRNLLQLDTKDLVLAAADFDPAPDSKAAGTWHVRYRQIYKGLPVHGGGARLVIHGNRLTMFGSDFYPSIAVRVKPRISADKAVAAARGHMRAKDSDGSVSRELVIYPKVHDSQVDYHLSWRITLPVLYNPAPGLKPESSNLPPRRRTDPVQWLYFVDAHSGAILDRFNLIRSDLAGTVTGMVHNEATTAPVSLPISDLNIGILSIPYGSDRLDRRPRGWSGRPIAPKTTVKPPPCPESLATTTGSAGQYQFPSLAGCGRTYLLSHLQGPFARIVNLAPSDPSSFYVSPVSSGTHNWNWANGDRSPEDVETSVFFHVNRVRNWFNRGGPFNVEPALKPMLAHVRDPGMWCNAQMRPDGLFFAAATPSDCPDMGLCGDIVYHEYTHSVVEEVYRPVDGLPLFGETLAMHEAFADYFAQSIVDDPRTAPTCTGSYARNLQTDKRYPEHIDSDPHVYGLILSGALWDVRTALGRDFVDGLALRAMKQWPMSFSEFLDAAVAEDDLLGYQLGADSNVSNGSPNIQAICTAFVENHGIYHPVCAGFTTAPTALIRHPARESSPFLIRSGTSSVEIRGAAAGSRNAAMAGFAIEYGHGVPPYTWQTVGIALAGGGTTAVADGVLANWNLSAVADGSYVVRLTVTDAAGGVSRYEVNVMIDRLLRSGWPAQILGGSATSYGNLVSAGVGNIVSASAGQEIFLLSCNGYILRPDGSLYTAFNIPGNSCEMAAPAIGDIDGDGDPDIVVASSEYLAAFRNDGNQLFDTVFSVAFGPGLPAGAPASPVLRDLDGDGRMEIIMAGLDTKLHIYRHDGGPFSHGGFTWPKSAAGPLRGTPAVADLDGDGRPEILVGSEDGNFYAWKLDGTNAAGWPKPVGRPIRSSAAVGNLDGDAANSLEIVVGAADGRVYAWRSDGSPMPGWPVSVVAMRPVSAAPALADLDNDGKLEVLAHGDAATLQIFKHDGTAFPGWTFPITGLTGHAPVVADLDGDQFPEIIVGPLQGKVFAFNRDGSAVSGFPRVLAQNVPGIDARRTPVLTDLDGDGRLELIVGAYVWNLPGSFNPLKQEWPTFHHDMTRSGKH